ncbi:hypothetical protein AVEN_168487-1 [Araneus ventricosus]|uniref:Uncharacterized protein n=1 Tax=Araneus ventricosus TaxID=182803 RepID=A0A4Y2UM38_ARAVE|nr:hypothetical protein AVEN_48097-1 [Araneus ventricosus]GBO12629.1 hypothetical protein AVEN_168487-1 [Araneus ventricosus]
MTSSSETPPLIIPRDMTADKCGLLSVSRDYDDRQFPGRVSSTDIRSYSEAFLGQGRLHCTTAQKKRKKNFDLALGDAAPHNTPSCIRHWIKGSNLSLYLWRSRCLVVRSRLWGRRVTCSKPDSTEDPSCVGFVVRKIMRRGTKHPPVAVVRKFGEEVTAQVSSSSSDRGSKLRGQSQNSPRVDSKRDVNIT